VIPIDLPFSEIWLHDFEFIPQPGEHHDVVCLVAHELRSGRTLRLWRDQLGASPPYRTDDDVLFVNFIANAECCCHLALGWPSPAKVLDLSPVFRNFVNGRSTPDGKGLLGALRYYGLDAIAAKQKDAMQKRVMQGWPFTPAEQRQILDYCFSDVDSLRRLLPKVLAEPEFNLGVALYYGEFAAVSGAMEHNGVPIDMSIFPELADDDTWRAVRDATVPTIDKQYSVYVRDAAGDWVFNMELFAAYLKREGLLAGWPRTDAGQLSMKDKVWDEAVKAWPQLEDLRQLRHIRNKMRRIKLAVGSDGRNRTVLWPFKAKTSRTQPAASEWIFSPAVWLRSLIKPAPSMAVAYIDYSSMEFLIAASLSDGHCGPTNRMLEMYQSGDPYLSFAKAVGAIPEHITKQTLGNYAAVRDRYKVLLLAVQYGMQTETLAARLGVTTFEAHEMLAQHHAQFRQYWAWSDDWVQHALQTGVMRTAVGWQCRTASPSLTTAVSGIGRSRPPAPTSCASHASWRIAAVSNWWLQCMTR
jgi:DNA polymerase I